MKKKGIKKSIKKSIQQIHKLKENDVEKKEANNHNINTYDKLIDKRGYLDFLHKKKKIETDGQCMYDTLEEIYLHKKRNFPRSNSNQQIQYLVHQIFKEKKIIQLQHLNTLLTHFLPFDESYELIKTLKDTKNISDKEIIDLIQKIKLRKTFKNTNFMYGSKCKPQDFMYQQLGFQIKKEYKKINVSYHPNDIQYLDICCGDGRKTIGLSEYLKIPIKNVHGTDIESWGPYQKMKKLPFDFKLIENNKLNYSDNSFDIITCFLSLHHIKQLSGFLNEIHRILKPTGLFLFIEHKPFDYTDELIIDIQHTLFAYLYDKNKTYLDHPDYSQYFNFMEWDYIMNQHKFKFINSRTIYQSVRKEVRYDEQFMALYQKSDKVITF